MDPDNQMKLAVMMGTDDIEYVDRAGCWATCHHDVRSMPHEPDEAARGGYADAQRLDMTSSITKYLTESRTEIEIKGKGGKKRGGWDKLKAEGDVQAEFDAGHYLDLLRYKSGSQESEDGHILEQRVMSGGQGSEFNAVLAEGTWTVVMKRKLQSDKSGDMSLAADELYNISFAIHDDYTNARFHHVSLGYKLGLDNDEAEIIAVKQ
jgi:cytochrome c-type protein NapC